MPKSKKAATSGVSKFSNGGNDMFGFGKKKPAPPPPPPLVAKVEQPPKPKAVRAQRKAREPMVTAPLPEEDLEISVEAHARRQQKRADDLDRKLLVALRALERIAQGTDNPVATAAEALLKAA